MKIDIYLRFSTKPGQLLKILVDFPGDEDVAKPVLYPMRYVDHAHWHFRMTLTKDQVATSSKLTYQYVFEDEKEALKKEN